MKTSRELKERRGVVAQQLKALNDKVTAEKRSFTEDEQKQWDKDSAELDQLDTDVAAAEKRESTAARAMAITGGADTRAVTEKDAKEIRKFNFAKAVNELRKGGLSGVEAEIHQEGQKEMRASGTGDSDGNGLALPSFMMRLCSSEERAMLVGAENRALSATGGSSGSEGGVAIGTEIMDLIPALKPAIVLADMGATMLNGLVGNVSFPRNTNVISAAWEGENTDADEVSDAFDAVQLTPKRLAAFSKVSRQLLMQNSHISNASVTASIESAIARAIMVGAINGSGSSNQPTGILNTSGIGSVAINTNGGAPTFAHMLALEKALADNDALTDMGPMGYLTTPGVISKLKGTEKTSTSTANFVATVKDSAKQIFDVNGYTARHSSLVPSTLTKGTSSGTCHAVIFGNWAELLIAQWSGVFITVDDITLAQQFQVKITVNTFNDIAVKHAKSFAAIKDALTA